MTMDRELDASYRYRRLGRRAAVGGGALALCVVRPSGRPMSELFDASRSTDARALARKMEPRRAGPQIEGADLLLETGMKAGGEAGA
jgi:hypothetical protein